jgi:cephalosporin hydroxylase
MPVDLAPYKGHPCQHRAADLPVIARILGEHRPDVIAELGTASGGFSLFLADTVAPWGGRVVTFDLHAGKGDEIAALRPNLTFLAADVLQPPGIGMVSAALSSAERVVLYCDNGHKEAELAIYASMIPVGGLLATHDYGTEVRPEWAEALVASHGFVPHRHDLMEALRDPPDYPEAMTRFWRRRQHLGAPENPPGPPA